MRDVVLQGPRQLSRISKHVASYRLCFFTDPPEYPNAPMFYLRPLEAWAQLGIASFCTSIVKVKVVAGIIVFFLFFTFKVIPPMILVPLFLFFKHLHELFIPCSWANRPTTSSYRSRLQFAPLIRYTSQGLCNKTGRHRLAELCLRFGGALLWHIFRSGGTASNIYTQRAACAFQMHTFLLLYDTIPPYRIYEYAGVSDLQV